MTTTHHPSHLPDAARPDLRRHGIVTGAELRPRHDVEALRRQGVLVRVHPDVFRRADAPDTFEARCAAACCTLPLGVVTGLAAARLWGFRYVFPVSVPELALPADTIASRRNVVVQLTDVMPTDAGGRDDGIRVAEPARAWFDCAPHLTDDRFTRLTAWVLRHRATRADLDRVAGSLRRRGRRGIGRVDRVLAA